MEEAIVQNAKCLKIVKEPLDAPQSYWKNVLWTETNVVWGEKPQKTNIKRSSCLKLLPQSSELSLMENIISKFIRDKFIPSELKLNKCWVNH